MLIRYLIRASYGNNSVALIQWAREEGLSDVVVLYSDTGWSRVSWAARVEQMETWVRSLGYVPARTESIGMEALLRSKDVAAAPHAVLYEGTKNRPHNRLARKERP